jgi:hypothetical protein
MDSRVAAATSAISVITVATWPLVTLKLVSITPELTVFSHAHPYLMHVAPPHRA